mmetsp:Transcript_76501/g.206060  ORF Transcript_76501/g.206060 Transcript_76501/m.206060 type:complete len:254 (+) Transcript_76501:760-1521(+)
MGCQIVAEPCRFLLAQPELAPGLQHRVVGPQRAEELWRACKHLVVLLGFAARGRSGSPGGGQDGGHGLARGDARLDGFHFSLPRSGRRLRREVHRLPQSLTLRLRRIHGALQLPYRVGVQKPCCRLSHLQHVPLVLRQLVPRLGVDVMLAVPRHLLRILRWEVSTTTYTQIEVVSGLCEADECRAPQFKQHTVHSFKGDNGLEQNRKYHGCHHVAILPLEGCGRSSCQTFTRSKYATASSTCFWRFLMFHKVS